jgi:hypothetical protein
MTNFTNWHYAKGRGTCGVYAVVDELSGRCYIGSAVCCEYRLELHRIRVGRRSRRVPEGLKRLAYGSEPVRLKYHILREVPEAELTDWEQAAIDAAGDKATNVRVAFRARR